MRQHWAPNSDRATLPALDVKGQIVFPYRPIAEAAFQYLDMRSLCRDRPLRNALAFLTRT
jgi:hypothetical protein